MISRMLLFPAAVATAALLSSCVHEWPENVAMEREIVLNIHHQLEWSPSFEMTVTRADEQPRKARYHFMLCPAGDQSTVIKNVEFFSDDLTRADFSTPLTVPPGDYELWTWTDWADHETQKSLHFDSSDFNSVWYPDPYHGNNDLRDALRGMTAFTIENTIHAEYSKEVTLNLERPLAKYEFISTDLAEFIDNETTRVQALYKAKNGGDDSRSEPTRTPDLTQYKVKMLYTGYMPSEFNNFLNRPVNSKTGMSYDADITMLNEDEARLGFDYVMVNGHESSIAVAMEVYDPEGNLIGRTNTINVPTERNRLTIVRGRFLTSMASGGVGINPDFDGDFNIEIK